MRWIRIMIAAVVIVLSPAQPAYAADPKADLAETGSTTTLATTSGVVTLAFTEHNYGPESSHGWTVRDFWAPDGTELISPNPSQSSDCTAITPKKHVRCRFYGQLWVDGHYNRPAGGAESSIIVKIVSAKDLTCGKVRISYDGDPKSSNNTATLRLKRNGKVIPCTKPKPSASPTRKAASPTPAAVASASMSPSPSPVTTDEPATESPTADEVPVLVGEDGGGIGSGAIVAGGLILVALGGGLLWWLRRRRPTGDHAHAA
ncbi:hypothetical protein AB0H43_15780 [Hamadaea sp. NPDC050747]|uniref:hypothetical protein n=1 Tax=Hamadaea sp. NPDC050747 TaxID=3155789 RepID=UPI0034036368